MILCGHCKSLHPTVAEVRKCSEGEQRVPRAFRSFTEEDEREMQRMEAEADRAESERDAAAKAAKWDWEARSFGAQMRNTDGWSLRQLLHEVDELLCTKEIPEADHRWSRAVRAMISGDSARVTEYALRAAIARLDAYPNVAAGRTSTGRPEPATRNAKPASAPERPVQHEGLYRLERDVKIGFETYRAGTLFQVVRNKEATHLYAKMVTFLPPVNGKNVRPRLDYVGGMVFKLQDAELLPIEEAEEITRKTGWCIFGHFLTNPVSIKRGMGPKCYERYPHLARNVEDAA